MGEPTFPRCSPAPLASRPLKYPSRSGPWPASRAAFRIVHCRQCRHTCNIVSCGSSQRASASTASGSEDMPISDNLLRGPTTQTSRRPKPMDSGALVAFPLSFPQLPLLRLDWRCAACTRLQDWPAGGLQATHFIPTPCNEYFRLMASAHLPSIPGPPVAQIDGASFYHTQ